MEMRPVSVAERRQTPQPQPVPPRAGRLRSALLLGALALLWLALLFLVSAFVAWRVSLASKGAAAPAVDPLAVALPIAAVAALTVVIAGTILLYPNIGIYLLALTAPLEEVLYISIGTFRWKPYEAVLLGLLLVPALRRQIRLDRLTGVQTLYVLVGLVGVALNVGTPLLAPLQTIAFELLMVLLFVLVRAGLLRDDPGDPHPRLAIIRTWIEWHLAPVVGWRRFRAQHAAADADESRRMVLLRVRRMTLFYVLIVGNAIALYGLGQFVGYYLGLPVPYFHPEAYAIFRPYATFVEPNPYGSFLSAQIAIAVTLLFSPSFHRWRAALMATLVLQAFLLAVNLSRGAWLAVAVMLAVLAAVRFGRAAADLPRAVLALAGAAALLMTIGGALYAWNPSMLQTIASRLATFTNPSDGTINWRTNDLMLALQAWLTKPVTGYGPGTWGTTVYGFAGRNAAVAPRNIIAAWLFERGLVGALLAIGFYKLLTQHAANAYRTVASEEQRALILAYGLATIAVFVGFLSATAEIVPYYWFQIGALLALLTVAPRAKGNYGA
jgi:O-antigen ligase